MTVELAADFEMRFDATAVHAQFRLPADRFSITVLFGPSGCGKTTTLRCLAGLERPQRGHIHFSGQVWFDAAQRTYLPPQQRDVGYLFQDYALFPHLRVRENIVYGLREYPVQQNRRLQELLGLFQLKGLERRYPRQLSGGQQQRVALARAVIRRPRLLLLDEPLSALDAATREELRRELRKMLAEFQTPVILVTHDRTEAIALADHVLVMDHGRVLQSGAVHDVFSRPADLSVARIAGVDTVERARVVELREGLATVEIGAARLTALANGCALGDVYLCIRAEDVILQQGDAPHSSARNQLRAIIRSLIREGPLVRVVIDCGFLLTALVTRPACEELGLAEGQSVIALLKATALHLIPRL